MSDKTLMTSLIFILYFCIAHLMFIDSLIINGDASFKTNLIKSYLWIFVFINWIYNFLYNILIKVYDIFTLFWENINFAFQYALFTIKDMYKSRKV